VSKARAVKSEEEEVRGRVALLQKEWEAKESACVHSIAQAEVGAILAGFLLRAIRHYGSKQVMSVPGVSNL